MQDDFLKLIYRYDPEKKQHSTVWVYRDEPKPTYVAPERNASKRMIASFLNKTKHVATVVLENRRTVNDDRYTTICLPEVIDEFSENNRKRSTILHHDSGSRRSLRSEKDVSSRCSRGRNTPSPPLAAGPLVARPSTLVSLLSPSSDQSEIVVGSYRLCRMLVVRVFMKQVILLSPDAADGGRCRASEVSPSEFITGFVEIRRFIKLSLEAELGSTRMDGATSVREDEQLRFQNVSTAVGYNKIDGFRDLRL
ncbi:hypothetical protein EVAR_60282_1 [Eumeta japonica]|uniref:Uncharacterized protein n=1 Tax=Eumeta variegata TaxID=151549 RepID=A0A4C1ZBF7_EUMVA|nr:hypothetical protein EVAR_60282_1 [Eumeta japonica]